MAIAIFTVENDFVGIHTEKNPHGINAIFKEMVDPSRDKPFETSCGSDIDLEGCAERLNSIDCLAGPCAESEIDVAIGNAIDLIAHIRSNSSFGPEDSQKRDIEDQMKNICSHIAHFALICKYLNPYFRMPDNFDDAEALENILGCEYASKVYRYFAIGLKISRQGLVKKDKDLENSISWMERDYFVRAYNSAINSATENLDNYQWNRIAIRKAAYAIGIAGDLALDISGYNNKIKRKKIWLNRALRHYEGFIGSFTDDEKATAEVADIIKKKEKKRDHIMFLLNQYRCTRKYA